MARPKNGKDFWTETKVKKLLSDTLDWMIADDKNVFVNLYLIEHQDLGDKMINYLLDKFSNSEEIVYLWDKIKDLEKLRLIKGSIDGTYKENMTKFLLNCKYDYVPRTQQQIELKGDNIKFSFGLDDDKDK